MLCGPVALGEHGDAAGNGDDLFDARKRLCLVGVGLCLLNDSFQEKPDPSRPVAIPRNSLQTVVVNLPMSLQIGTEIEHGTGKLAFFEKEKRNKDAADAVFKALVE